MGAEAIAALIAGIVAAVLAVLKGLWGTKKPQERTVEHPAPDVEVVHEDEDADRLRDLGL